MSPTGCCAPRTPAAPVWACQLPRSCPTAHRTAGPSPTRPLLTASTGTRTGRKTGAQLWCPSSGPAGSPSGGRSRSGAEPASEFCVEPIRRKGLWDKSASGQS
eukprot:1148434-Pelagomonas_calceolata.AAC.1